MQKKSSNFVKIRYAPSKAKVENLIKKYVKSIKEKIDLKLAILFGSYAKNTYSYGSDVDILLVAQKLPKRIIERPQKLINLNIPLQIEPFAYTPEEFNKMVKENHPLINEALHEGKIIYAAEHYKELLTRIKSKRNKTLQTQPT